MSRVRFDSGANESILCTITLDGEQTKYIRFESYHGNNSYRNYYGELNGIEVFIRKGGRHLSNQDYWHASVDGIPIENIHDYSVEAVFNMLLLGEWEVPT